MAGHGDSAGPTCHLLLDYTHDESNSNVKDSYDDDNNKNILFFDDDDVFITLTPGKHV